MVLGIQPPRILAGSMIIALKTANTPVTAMPIILKGSRISQTSG